MDQERFKEEVVPLRERLLAVAGRMLGDGDEAGDMVQEVFLKLWIMRTRLNALGNIPAFAVRMTRNACLSRIRVQKRNAGPLPEQLPAETVTPHRQLENREHLDRTMRIIDTLPPVQQAILRMKHIDGLEIREIAALTGSNPEAVRVNLSRARKRVKELFLKEEQV